MNNRDKYKQAFSVLHSNSDISADIDKLADAMRQQRLKRRQKTIVKWAYAVTAIILTCVIIFELTRRSDEKVIYASEYDGMAMWDYNENSKVNINHAVKEIKGNPRIRVAILVRDITQGYPDMKNNVGAYEGYTSKELRESEEKYSGEYEAGTISDEEYGEFMEEYYRAKDSLMERMLEEEKAFLESQGAEDASIQANCTILCTISKNDINNLSNGKCKYVVVMYTKNDKDIEDISIEGYFGQYTDAAFIGIPAMSSMNVPEFQEGKLVIDNEHIEIVTDSETIFSSYNCTYEKVVRDSDEDIFDMTYFCNVRDLDMFEFENMMKAGYKVKDEKGYETMLFITTEGLYIDFGLGGIYRFKK